ncbi:MAG: glycosyltransferase, partial [Candidatus Kryptoniota bacterium]
AIAPMRFGAGTLNKIIEPIVLGIPVVATSIAVRGLPDAAQKFIEVAETPGEFASAVINILKNKKVRELYKGSEEIRESLSWAKIVADFESDLKDFSQPKKTTTRELISDIVKPSLTEQIGHTKMVR